jgi:hypothetical protein
MGYALASESDCLDKLQEAGVMVTLYRSGLGYGCVTASRDMRTWEVLTYPGTKRVDALRKLLCEVHEATAETALRLLEVA